MSRPAGRGRFAVRRIRPSLRFPSTDSGRGAGGAPGGAERASNRANDGHGRPQQKADGDGEQHQDRDARLGQLEGVDEAARRAAATAGASATAGDGGGVRRRSRASRVAVFMRRPPGGGLGRTSPSRDGVPRHQRANGACAGRRSEDGQGRPRSRRSACRGAWWPERATSSPKLEGTSVGQRHRAEAANPRLDAEDRLDATPAPSRSERPSGGRRGRTPPGGGRRRARRPSRGRRTPAGCAGAGRPGRAGAA